MTDNKGQNIGFFRGVSLASFLQMLEQEQKTCTLTVQVGDATGKMYFTQGELVDAELNGQAGADAVYTMLAWDSPGFRVDPPVEKNRVIYEPLAHLLLAAATQSDEKQHEIAENEEYDPQVRRLLEAIKSTAGVKEHYFLDRKGKLIVGSSEDSAASALITHIVISGVQMGKVFRAKGPQRIQLSLTNNEVLLIVPGGGMIIGLVLSAQASVEKTSALLRQGLRNV